MEEPLDMRTDPETAAQMAANSVLRYLNGLEIADSMGKVNWVRKVVDIVFSKIQESNNPLCRNIPCRFTGMELHPKTQVHLLPD